jgi:hypothetical protein
MDVQADQVQCGLAGLEDFQRRAQVVHRHAELGAAGGGLDARRRAALKLGDEAQGDVGALVQRRRHVADALQLEQGIDVDRLDRRVDRRGDLGAGFGDAVEHDGPVLEAGAARFPQLALGVDLEGAARLADELEDRHQRTGLAGIGHRGVGVTGPEGGGEAFGVRADAARRINVGGRALGLGQGGQIDPVHGEAPVRRLEEPLRLPRGQRKGFAHRLHASVVTC